MTNKHKKKTQRDKNGNFKQTNKQKKPDVSPKRRSGDAKAVGKGEVMLYGALAQSLREKHGNGGHELLQLTCVQLSQARLG